MMSSGYTSLDNQKVSGSVPAVSDPGQATVKFTASNLQTFPPSEAKGKISGDYRPPRDADDSFSKPVPGGGSDEPQSRGWMRIFTVAAYKPYFDVDTSDVLERIKDSLIPFRGNFTEKTANNPDLYGPFWICTTLIFVAASIGTFVTYVAHKLQNKDWDYDINMITWSAGLFYGYVTLVPLCLYIILKYFSAPSGLVQLFCLYGYSLFVFIPASCLSVVPGDIFKWVIAGVAGFMSATFVALNLRAHIMSAVSHAHPSIRQEARQLRLLFSISSSSVLLHLHLHRCYQPPTLLHLLLQRTSHRRYQPPDQANHRSLHSLSFVLNIARSGAWYSGRDFIAPCKCKGTSKYVHR